ncbi:MAG: hypothetical protein ACLUSP_05450 [Christensenellales bacterium]
MYATNYFMTLAAGALPSGVLYPLSYGAGFVLTAIMDTVFFKQKLTLPRAVATVSPSPARYLRRYDQVKTLIKKQ